MNIDIVGMKRLPSNQMVILVDWIASKESSGVSVNQHGSTELPPSDPNADGFIPFDNLTRGQVEQWVRDEIDEAALESKLDQRINDKMNPSEIAGLPAGFFPPEDES